MTSNIELDEKLRFLKSFIGVFPCDRIPSFHRLPASMIVNTDKHNERGEHWVAIYISDEKIGYYFDSYGLPPLNKEIEDYINANTTHWKYNQKGIQGLNSIKCGQFSVLFIILKTIGYTFNQITHLFTNNYNTNDVIIQRIYDSF